MVSNQDGLGTDSFPEADFRRAARAAAAHPRLAGHLFREVLIDRSFAHEGLDTRKPGVGMVRHYLADDGWIARAVGDGRRSRDRPAVRRQPRRARLPRRAAGHDAGTKSRMRCCDAPRIAEVRARHARNQNHACASIWIAWPHADDPHRPRLLRPHAGADRQARRLRAALRLRRRYRTSTSTTRSRTARWRWARP